MRFVLLGTGTLVPDAERGPAGFLVERNGTRILVDGGSGTLQRLARYGVDARKLDAGVYSHWHLDHCGDLAPLLFAMRVGIGGVRREQYPIWAGEGFREFLGKLEATFPGWIRSDNFGAVVQELSLQGPDAATLPGGIRLDTRPAVHSAGALHLRFTSPEGATVVFSGDTGPSPALAELATGVDLLVTECAAAEPDPWNSHLWPEAVAEVVARARPKRVLLTHFYPGLEESLALEVVGRCGVPVSRAWDGQVVDLG